MNQEEKINDERKSFEQLAHDALSLPGAAEIMRIMEEFAALDIYYQEAMRILRPQYLTTVSSSSIITETIDEG